MSRWRDRSMRSHDVTRRPDMFAACTDTSPAPTASIAPSTRAGIICVAIGTGFLACAAVLLLVFRDSIGYLFVDSADVAAVVASICPIAALYQIPDGVLGTIGGVLRRAPGRHHLMPRTIQDMQGIAVR